MCGSGRSNPPVWVVTPASAGISAGQAPGAGRGSSDVGTGGIAGLHTGWGERSSREGWVLVGLLRGYGIGLSAGGSE